MQYFFKSVLALGILFIGAASALAYKNGDAQYWNTESVSFKLNDKVGVYIEEEFRFGDDIGEFYYQHSQVQLDFKMTDWFVFSPAYRQVFELYTKSDGDEGWFSEYRPMINGLLKCNIRGWSLSDRVRFSYRMFNIDKGDLWNIRNKVTVKLPWKWTFMEINPWVADEIFLEEHKAGVYRNRFYLGVEMKFTEYLKGDLYYLLQATEGNGGWTNYNVLGTKLKIEF